MFPDLFTVQWGSMWAPSHELPPPTLASTLFMFNGDLLESCEYPELASRLGASTVRIRMQPEIFATHTQTGSTRLVFVRWERDPKYWRMEHGAAVDAFAHMTQLTRATLQNQRQWSHRPCSIPQHDTDSDPDPTAAHPIQQRGLTPCIGDKQSAPLALVTLVLQALGPCPTTDRPDPLPVWWTLLESAQATEISVFTGATHLTPDSWELSDMDTLLASACEACGWTATIGELLDLLPD